MKRAVDNVLTGSNKFYGGGRAVALFTEVGENSKLGWLGGSPGV
jgi:hypothetical protein